VNLRVRLLDPAARLPQRAHEDDAGYDLCSVETHVIGPGERARVRTGISIELPQGHAGWVVPRSGLADRHGISLVNAPGLIDPGYRGEIAVLLLNTDLENAFTLVAGARLAQIVFTPVAFPDCVEVEELTVTARGAGGFGSTGG
jgi:dUTP pyrophosphatase